MIPTQEENPNGLHLRYLIEKADGESIDPRAEYFILRLDNFGDDPIHIAACRKAVLTYADAIQDHIPKLARDIKWLYGE